MVFNYLNIFASLHRQYKLYESEKAESLLKEQKLSLEKELENQQYIRKIRHDMRGHTITLQGLLKAGKAEEAFKYLDEMEQSIKASDVRICENPYINAQLSHYLQKFCEIDTELVCDIKIGDEELPSIHRICNILSNALQNALEELAIIPKEEREVSLQMKYNKDYLIFRLRNRCREDLVVEKGNLPGTEKQEKGHGYGLKSIKETAEALGGDMVCYTENNCFVLDVMVRAKGIKGGKE
ncbi:MAG: GHKL domain-containing protein, partial [Clostridia bacterium]|nr:GHKL domain-containing protein [Clostridia bacterium]